MGKISGLKKRQRKKKTKQPPSSHSFFKKSTFIVSLCAIVFFLFGCIFGMLKEKNDSLVEIPSSQPQKASVTLSVREGWKTYTDKTAGFSFQYPENVLLATEPKEVTDSVLTVMVDPIDALPEEAPLGMDKNTALVDREALRRGEAKTTGDFAASDGLVQFPSLNARLTSTLSRFDVCSVVFERRLVFYPGTYRVILTFTGVPERIMRDMPEFFTIDPANCGREMRVWDRGNMGDFMPTLAQKKGRGAGQEWFDTFNSVIQTIALTTSD